MLFTYSILLNIYFSNDKIDFHILLVSYTTNFDFFCNNGCNTHLLKSSFQSTSYAYVIEMDIGTPTQRVCLKLLCLAWCLHSNLK